jgi:uroporphyrinogen decarboxylase
MVAGRGSTDQADARLWAYRDPEGFQRLIDLLTEASVAYLSGQAEAGADVLQIFDTWAGNLPDDAFQRWVVAPTRKLVAQVKANHPGVPIIGFPRGAGSRAAAYITETGVDGIGCDTTMPLSFMRETLAPRAVVQGNLDPLLLVAGGGALDRRVDEILTTLGDRRFIFNLGHGILPQTPPERVARLVELVRR